MEKIINEYKDKIHIIKTPKKGGTGLNESLEGICQLAKAMCEQKDEDIVASKYCF